MASASANGMDSSPTDSYRIEPVFIKNTSRDIILEPYDICMAAGHCIGNSQIEGVQQINNIWRIYVKTKESRAKLIVKKEIIINSVPYQVYDRNPALTRLNPEECERITIKDLPLSVSNSEIQIFLREHNVESVSPIRYGKIRDANGDLTNFKNGDRFLFVKSPVWPLLPRNCRIAEIRCKIFHDGQFRPHCTLCQTPGHRLGDEQCKGHNSSCEIIPFKSQHNVLSNFYMSNIDVYGETFKSAEHAYQHRRAIHANLPDLAGQIKRSAHAGIAKRLSKSIPADPDKGWETKCLEVMTEIIAAKTEQVAEFKERLLETGECYLAEATGDTFWACGLSVEDAVKVNPKFHPGTNNLGLILMRIRSQILHESKKTDNGEETNTSMTNALDNEDNEELDCPFEETPTKNDLGDETNIIVLKPKSQLAASISASSLQSGSSENGSSLKSSSAKGKKLSEAAKPQSSGNKHGVMTNIKDMLTQQRDKTKRKSSKTPEKNKGIKLQKQK